MRARFEADADASAPSGVPASASLVSVILPVWQPRPTLRRAVASVLSQSHGAWELLVVIDREGDKEERAVRAALPEDPRIRVLTQPHAGVCAARNHGLRNARGDLVAYLDSDNEWTPHYLSRAAATLDNAPGADATYQAQYLVDARDPARPGWLRFERFDRARLQQVNFIDLNVFCHRRRLVSDVGGFDEAMTRLVDWDFIERCTRSRDPIAVDRIGVRYEQHRADSISSRESFWSNHYHFQRKRETRTPRPLRVLYAVWNYPHITEAYMHAEIAAMRRWGAEIQVFSERTDGANHPAAVPVHHGSLEDAIRSVRPHVIHSHWLHDGARFQAAAHQAGLPVTVRGHGFEFTEEMVARLQSLPAVKHVYLFPHLAARLRRRDKITPVAAAFDADRFAPRRDKDRRLVVRTGAGLPTKDLRLVVDTARLCPDHRFVLVMGRAVDAGPFTDEIVAYNQLAGAPVEIQIDLPAGAAARLVERAGIYLHTSAADQPFGMPISIAEAMSTGCFIVARQGEGARGYVGDAGTFYRDAAEAAAAIRATLAWTDEQWDVAWLRSVDRAYQSYSDIRALRVIFEDWVRLAAPHMGEPRVETS